jgi:hypothetical protein
VGPLTAIDLATDTFEVMGRTVQIEASTITATDLRPGETVAVSGLRNSDGRIVASRIDRAPAGTPAILRGPVTGASADGLYVNGRRVRLAPAIDPAAYSTGQEITLFGEVRDGDLMASRARGEPALPFEGRVQKLVIEGYIDRQGRLVSPLNLPQAMDAAQAGQRVVVEGAIDPERHVVTPSARSRPAPWLKRQDWQRQGLLQPDQITADAPAGPLGRQELQSVRGSHLFTQDPRDGSRSATPSPDIGDEPKDDRNGKGKKKSRNKDKHGDDGWSKGKKKKSSGSGKHHSGKGKNKSGKDHGKHKGKSSGHGKSGGKGSGGGKSKGKNKDGSGKYASNHGKSGKSGKSDKSNKSDTNSGGKNKGARDGKSGDGKSKNGGKSYSGGKSGKNRADGGKSGKHGAGEGTASSVTANAADGDGKTVTAIVPDVPGPTRPATAAGVTPPAGRPLMPEVGTSRTMPRFEAPQFNFDAGALGQRQTVPSDLGRSRLDGFRQSPRYQWHMDFHNRRN